jgi:uncharacterized DUF497 family protein
MAAKVRKGGPKKKAGDRYPGGKLKEGSNVSEFALQRRAEAAGVSTEDARKRMEAGYALGQLMTRRVITVRQHDAGMAYRAAWMRWASLAGLPPHEVMQKGSGAQRPDVDPEQWEKAKAAFSESTKAIFRCEQPRLVWAAVESVVMDDVLPPMMESRWIAVAAINAGLSALAAYYKMPDRLAG